MPSATPTSTNRTLARVAALLDAAESKPASAAELARRSGLSVSTAHRLAVAMADHGFLRRDESGLFRLGQRFLRTALEKAVALPLPPEHRDALANYGAGRARLVGTGRRLEQPPTLAGARFTPAQDALSRRRA